MKQTITTLAAVLLLAIGAGAQQHIPLQYGAQYSGKRTDEAMNKWRSNRFGQFIHWGLYAIPGGVWNGKTYPYAAEFLKSSAKVADATWYSLMYRFNPAQFNPREWARMARQMGVKYMTITTKHHEGFCLWPSKFTSFNIAHTPYKKDLIRELVNAYNAAGIDVNFYYSVLDWHHPDWRYDIKSKEDSIAFARYLSFAKDQLRELAENYPTVKAFWFDGTWDNSIKKNGKWTFEVEQMLKTIRPGMIVNSRLRADDYGKRHKDSNGALMGDYESGYERRLPDPVKDVQVTKWDWEACMTVPENQWGYHKDWSISYVKSPLELLEMLVHTTSMGGNFLLNFGPDGNGNIRPEEQHIAKVIGSWMQQYSNVIYHCDYAGWEKQDWGYYTRQSGSDTVNMIVFNIPVSGKLKIRTPANVKISTTGFPLREAAKDQYVLQLPATTYKMPLVIRLKITSGTTGQQYQEAKT